MPAASRLSRHLRLLAALSACVLFLLIACATHYQTDLAGLFQHTGILEVSVAAIPLLSLLLAAIWSRPRKAQPVRHQSRH